MDMNAFLAAKTYTQKLNKTLFLMVRTQTAETLIGS